ncbi:MAG: DsrE family protein [Candidatus Hodarchaeota archaeon]
MNKVIVVFRQGPYGSVYPIEAARITQVLIAMDLQAVAVFIDDGVYTLTKNHNPEGINMHPIRLTIENLRAIDVPLYAIDKSLKERGLKKESLDFEPKIIDLEMFSRLILDADTTLFF